MIVKLIFAIMIVFVGGIFLGIAIGEALYK